MMMTNLMVLATMARLRLKEVFCDEKGEVNIVAMIILIVIAVMLALLFREQIGELVNKLFESIKGKEEDLSASFTP